MKKFILSLALAFSAVFCMNAEDVTFSVKAGVGVSSWMGGDADYAGARFAYRVGFGVDIPVHGKFGFQTGLNFEQLGTNVDSPTYVQTHINQMYLELPLMGTFRFGAGAGNFVVNAGPYLGVGVGGKSKVETSLGDISDKTFGDDGMKRFDMGVGIGINYEISHFLFGIDTRMGFLHNLKGVKSYNDALFFNFGYRF